MASCVEPAQIVSRELYEPFLQLGGTNDAGLATAVSLSFSVENLSILQYLPWCFR